MRWALPDSCGEVWRWARACCWSAALGVGLAAGSRAAEPDWQVLKGQHFILYHHGNEAYAAQVMTRAETCYEEIADDLGFARRTGFWVWDKRVKVFLYDSRAEFAAACGAPLWAAGKADYDKREIAGCGADTASFLNNLLPHELTHLIFRDYVGPEQQVPNWLEEGIAQWEEQGGRDRARQTLRGALRGGRWIPLEELTRLDSRRLADPGQVALYYAEAASVVGFLITRHGGERFGLLCAQLRDGRPLADALRKAYPDRLASLAELEAAWLKAMGGGS